MKLFKLYGIWDVGRVYIDWFHIHSAYIEKSELRVSDIDMVQLAVL
jgi:hypothetical protein